MAGSRHYWWERYTAKLNPRKWLDKLIPSAPKPERRRGSREFGPPPERPAPTAVGAGRDPFRNEWTQEGSPGSYRTTREFFDSIPAVYRDQADELDTWRSFLQHMTTPRPGVRFNDPGNPFWSQIGLNPRHFDWAGWRAAIRPGDTP